MITRWKLSTASKGIVISPIVIALLAGLICPVGSSSSTQNEDEFGSLLNLQNSDPDKEKIRSILLDLLANDTSIHNAVHHAENKVRHSLTDIFTDNVNAFFLISMAIQVHIMQCGFALLETGCIRAKSASNSMWKNCVCGFVAAIGFYLTGFGFAFGKSLEGFFGTTFFAYTGMSNSTSTVNNANFWFFEYSFCTTAATIISGAIAERGHIVVFLLSSFLMSSVTYPFIAHWVWNSQGWLKVGSIYNATTHESIGFDDFAGSGVVHLTGGAASLAAIIFLNARLRRFPTDGSPKWEPIAHSTTFVALGCMILSTEFVAFNSGSELRIDHSGDATHIGLAAVNTMLAGAAGFLSVSLYDYWKTRKFRMLPPLCGSLAGNVAICAGCDVVEPWAAIAIGFIAGLVCYFIAWALPRARLDDPVDAVGVHLGGGVTGLLTLAFLKPNVGIFYAWDARSAMFLGWQVAGTLVIFAWAFAHTVVVLLLVRWCKLLKLSEKDEEDGMDIAHGHEIAYPKAAYFDSPTGNRTQMFAPVDEPVTNNNECQHLVRAINEGRAASHMSSTDTINTTDE